MFVVTGPGSPGVLTNMILASEHHVDWIGDTIAHLDAHGLWGIEAAPVAQDRWVRHCTEVADGTLFPRADSWYLGANVPGKPRVFMPFIGGFGTYRKIVADVTEHGYRGFTLLADAQSGSPR
jgi:cyclohexanone monooxygenase